MSEILSESANESMYVYLYGLLNESEIFDNMVLLVVNEEMHNSMNDEWMNLPASHLISKCTYSYKFLNIIFFQFSKAFFTHGYIAAA